MAATAHEWQQLMRAQEAAVIKRALEHLPKTCKYHGDKIEDHRNVLNLRYGGACCATGEPALARRYAETVLEAQTDDADR